MKKFDFDIVAKNIAIFCIKNNIKFLFISGNGGSGKTTLSKQIAKEIGSCNVIEMDDFVVDTKLRNSASASWIDSDTKEGRIGKYTTSFEASYFLQNVKAIICNLRRGNNYWHWPKKAKAMDESVNEFKANAKLTIVEGITSVFLPKDENDTLGIFMQCSKEIEIERRIKRARSANEQNPELVEKSWEERNSQFKTNILPFSQHFDLFLSSNKDYSLNIIDDKKGIFYEI